MMLNPEDILKQKLHQNQLESGFSPEQEDMAKWEMDTSLFIEEIYNELLGNVKDIKIGSWKRDNTKSRFMNELGASAFIKEVRPRLSIHMQMSDLDEKNIIEISSLTAEVFADKLEDNWELWAIDPIKSNLMSIGWMLYHILYITLRIAKGGGMKKHRERSKNPYLGLQQQQTTEEGVI